MKTFTFYSRYIITLCLLLCVTSNIFAQRHFATDQRTGATGLLCVNCLVTDSLNAKDANLQTHSTLNVAVGLLAATYQELIFPASVAANTPLTIKLGTGNNLLDVTALGGVVITPYNGNVAGTSVSAPTLASVASSNNQLELIFSPTTAYDRVRVTLNGGLLGALSSIYLYDAFYTTPGPAICNTAYDELHGISSALLNLGLNIGGVVNPQNAIDGNINTASTLNAGVGALGAFAQETIIFQSASTVGDSVRFTLSIPKALLDVGLLTNITVSSFNGNTSNNDTQQLSGSLLRLRLLDLTNNRQRIQVTYAPSKVFDRVQLRLGGIASVLSTLDLYEAEVIIPKPIITINNVAVTDAQLCAGSTITLTATSSVPGTTFNWYAQKTGGSPVATTAAFTTPALTVNTTYYVSATRPGCATVSDRAAVNVNVNQVPVAPVVVNPNIAICPGGSAVFAATPVTGVTINWYTAATGGTLAFTGNTFNTGVLNATTSYYAEAVVGGTCVSATRTKVTATLNPLPAAPTLTAPNATICDGDVAVLAIASPVAGQIYNWYDAATGGNLLFTGVNFTSPVLHANTSYYAEAVNITGCASGSRVQANVTVQPKPADPVLGVNSTTVTSGQTATINVTNAQTGITYKWYASVGAATPIFTGSSFTTPALFSTITYYVAAVNTTGCESVNRTAITLNVGVNNSSAPCTFANSQTPTITGGPILCLGCSITSPELAADADTTTASTIKLPVALLGASTSQMLKFQQPGFAGDVIKLALQTPGGLADISLFGGINISVYNGTTLVGSYALNNPLLTLRVLSGTDRYSVSVPAVGNYDRVEVAINGGVATVLTTLQVYYAVQQYPTPVFDTPAPSICKGGNATINITSPNPANGTYKWYATPTGGTAIASTNNGATFTTPALTANTTYYVEYNRNGSCASPVRVPVPVTVNDVPVKPVVTPPSSVILAGETATFKATVVNGATIKWYTQPTGGTPVFTGSTFTTPVLSTNATYYAEASLGTCVSPDRTVVPVTVTPVVIPDVTVTPPTQSVNIGTTGTIAASSTTPGTIFNWYSAPTGGTLLFTGATYVTPPAFANATYYAEAVVTATGAKSATRAPAVVNVITVGSDPVACDAATSQTTSQNGACLLCSTTNATAAVDQDRNTFSQIHVGIGLAGGSAQQLLKFANPGIIGDSVIVELGIPGSLVDVGLLSQINIATYTGATNNNDRFQVDGSLLHLTLLNGTNRFRVAFKATHAFDGVEIQFNSGVAGLLSAVNVYDAYQSVAAPVLANPSGISICQGTSGTLTASPVPANVTIKWYATATGGTALGTGNSFPTPVLNVTTTYYAEAIRTSSTCAQSVRTPVTVTVTPALAPPSVNLSATVCAGQPAIFTADAVSGVTFNWYDAATGGTLLASNQLQFTTPALTTTTSYYVEAVSVACGTSARVKVTATVTPAPAPPIVSPTPVQICTGSQAVVSVSTVVPNITYTWYTTATGGTPVGSGSSYTTPALTASTSYYVEAASTGGCTSSTRAKADVSVNPTPVAPIVTINPPSGQITSGQTATLTASSSTPGVTTYKWYLAQTGGTAVLTGTTVTTPALTSNTTYYVEAITGFGCISDTRTAVTITVNPIFSTSCDFASTQLPVLNGGLLCVNCAVNSGDDAVDVDTTNFSQIVVPVGVAGSMLGQQLIFSNAGVVGDTVRVKISIPITLASAGVLNQLEIGSYNGATFNNDRIPFSSSLLKLTILAGQQTAIIKFAPKAAFDRVEVRLNGGLLALLGAVNIYYATKQVELPAVDAKAKAICAGNTASFTVTNPRAGISYKWYADATGGSALTTNTTFTTPVLNATTTYYVESSRTATGCVNPNRVAVTVNVTPAPGNPVLAQASVPVCSNSGATFTVSPTQNGVVYNWYATATGGTSLATGAQFNTPPLTSNTSYWVEASANGCVSPARTKADAVVNPVPVAPTYTVNPSGGNITAGGTATINAASVTPSVIFKWYTTLTGGNAIFTGTPFTTPVLNTTTTYYIESTLPSGCVSTQRTPVIITVTQPVVIPDVAVNPPTQTINTGATGSLTATSTTPGAVFDWFTTPTGGSPVATNTATFTSPNLFANTTYYAESSIPATGIKSATRAAGVINVSPTGTSPVPCDAAVSQTSSTAGPVCLLCGTTNNDAAVDNNGSSFSQIHILAGLLGASSEQTLHFANAGIAGDSVTVDLGIPGSLADVGLLSQIQVGTFNGATDNGDRFTVDGSLLNIKLLNGTSRFRVTFVATKPFDGVQITFNAGVVTALSAVNVYDAYQSVAKPIVANPAGITICQGTSGTLTATPVPANVTIKWYTAAVGGTLIGTGNSVPTPILTSTTTYYAEASRAASGCAQAIRTPVTVTVTPAPAAPIVAAPNKSVCSGSQATFTAQAVTGVSFNWYAAATGGTALATNTATFTSPTLTASADYYVEAVAGTCGSSTRTKVTATVTPTPSTPVLAAAPPICSGSFAVLSVSPVQQGVTYNWYTTSTGGTAVATNTANYTTPNLTANTTYYVEAVATTGGCTSATRGSVNVTVNPLPVAPTITATPNNGQIVSGGTATLTASSAAGTTINWYTSASGGTPIATTASFTTPALTSNTTYYAEAVSSTTGCISSTRTPFTVQVNPIFVTSCDFASHQLFDVNNGIACLNCGVDNPDNAVDANLTNFSTLNLPVAVGAYVSQKLMFDNDGNTGDTVRVKIQIPAGVLDASIFGHLQIASYSGTGSTVYNNDRIDLSSSLLKVDLLPGGQTAIIAFAPKTAFNAVEIRITAGVALLTSLNIYYASKLVEAPTLVSNTSNICAGSRATFIVSNARAGITYKWYDAAVGGNLVFTGANFEKDGIMTTTTYFVEASRTSTNCVNPNRVAATVNVTPLPPNPVVGPYAAICAGQAVTLNVTNANGAIINWYTTQTGGTPVLANSATFSPSPQSDITYYVEAVSVAGGCSSPARVAVPVTVNPLPLKPGVQSANVSVCLGSPVTLSVLLPETGVTYNWYTAASGGTIAHIGIDFPTQPITQTVTYYIEATNGGCINNGDRTEVTVTPDALPVTPTLSAASTTVCNGGGTTITVTNATQGITYNWYDAATGGTLLHTGTSYTVSNLTANISYFVEAVNANGTTNCTSATRGQVDITVTPIPTPPVVVTPAGGNQTCSGTGITLTIQNPLPGITYNWYDAATGGNLVHTGSSFATGPLTADITYWVEASNGNGCTSSGRTSVPVTVNATPANPVLASNPLVCLNSPATITVTAVPGVTYKWYTAASGGTPVFTGNPYVTGPITATTDFYVEAVNGTGCSSGSRTLAEVTIDPAPAAPVIGNGATAPTCAGTPAILTIANPQGGLTYNWYTTPSGGTPVAANTTSFTTPALTANTTYYAEAVNATGCGSASRTAVQVIINQLPTTPAPIAQGGSSTPTVCSGGFATLTATATPPTGVTFKWYAQATGGSPVFVGIPFTTPAIMGTTTYYVEAVVNATGCTSETRGSITINIDNTKAPNPAVDAAGLITCQNSATTLNITNPVSGTVYSWYAAATGGSAINTGQSFNTPVLTANTTYYVEATNPQSCNPSTRVAVNVTVAPQPSTPTFAVQGPVQVCRGSSADIAIASPQANLTYNWYTSASKTTLVFTGPTLTTGPVNANATYYIEAVSGSCASTSLASIQVVAVDAPDAPVVAGGNSINDCQGGQATLTIANPQSGLTYKWYSSASGGTALATGTSFTTPSLSANTIYFAEAVNVTGCASASRTSVTVIVTSAPIAPQASTDGTSICPGTSATISATSATPGSVIKWYADASGGAVLATGISFTTPTLSATTTYYAEAEVAGGCVSIVRTPVTVTVLGPLTAPVVTVDANAATASSVTFVWQAVTGATGYQISIDNGQHFITPSSGAGGLTHTVTNLQPAQSVTIIVRANGNSDCQQSANSAAVTGTSTNPFGNGLFIPNVFTPNGDGSNDVLFVYGNAVKSLTLSIYDQWGELQFKSTNKASGWDGTYKGTNQPVGVYVYYVEATMNDGQVVKKKGTVTLLR
ncbi:gliding motility-associated C-terminal domain-containing protein [Mucilaginibacter aquaedulcis]|uniref:gliding motility-associated C-terminal domain-containing protein n=1 Tax=Mucilaginibacter aquaedulcis TaxID=1187081 RepID=UPI0025B4FACF|nr:gliding motility-associated C-terminal domain-containing protein [Mucilaginibacter aquaedulcis]MDN3550333.1 gliding motility-associated C-terminal domain-containing protein [Mucilaginibacter aquaedulcis]